MKIEKKRQRFFKKFIKEYKLNFKFYILSFDSFIKQEDFFKSKIKLKCKKCEAIQIRRWSNLKKTSKCISCEGKKLSSQEFENRFYKIHKNLKLLSEYDKMWRKVKILCLSCNNIFEAMPSNLISKYNKNSCPFCKRSSLEIMFKEFLLKYNFNDFIEQFLLSNFDPKWPKYKFDFYFPKPRIAIEIDGQQHFKNYRGKKKFSNFKKLKQRDFFKNRIAFIENIKLIRIPFFIFQRKEFEDDLKNILIKEKYFMKIFKFS